MDTKSTNWTWHFVAKRLSSGGKWLVAILLAFLFDSFLFSDFFVSIFLFSVTGISFLSHSLCCHFFCVCHFVNWKYRLISNTIIWSKPLHMLILPELLCEFNGFCGPIRTAVSISNIHFSFDIHFDIFKLKFEMKHKSNWMWHHFENAKHFDEVAGCITRTKFSSLLSFGSCSIIFLVLWLRDSRHQHPIYEPSVWVCVGLLLFRCIHILIFALHTSKYKICPSYSFFYITLCKHTHSH